MMRRSRLSLLKLAASTLALGLTSCVVKGELPQDTYRLRVELTRLDGSPLPDKDHPLCLDLRGLNPECPDGEEFLLSVEAFALGPDGRAHRDTSYNRFARVSSLPGTVLSVEGDKSDGRNVLLENGVVSGQRVKLIGAFGPTNLLVEDIGYQPVSATNPDKPPSCADGLDNDGDGLIDYPADPGCAFSNDDTEEGGTHAAGVASTIHYSYPTITQIQGYGAGTPFSQEGVVAETTSATVVVSSVASDGFYVVDVDPATRKPKPYGSLFVFNFSTPPGLRVCDRLTYLAGTMDEFYGYTEMNFPSFTVHPWVFPNPEKNIAGDGPCLVPDAFVLTPAALGDSSSSALLENYEAGLVRIENAHVASHFGPGKPQASPFDLSPAFSCQGNKKFTFSSDASNCDLDQDGKVDFTPGTDEALCSCFCFQDAECSEWTSFQGRSNFRMVLGKSPYQTIQANMGAVPGFTPRSNAGKTLKALTGTLANFSGGDLNWTIQARCPDDLVQCPDDQPDCDLAPLASDQACVRQRTENDNDSGSN